VDLLEREVAALLGHEAALFVPSRTMANLISILVWCSSRGSTFICGEASHVFMCEEGGAAQVRSRSTRVLPWRSFGKHRETCWRNALQFGGVSPFPIPNEPDGSLDLEKLQKVRQEVSVLLIRWTSQNEKSYHPRRCWMRRMRRLSGSLLSRIQLIGKGAEGTAVGMQVLFLSSFESLVRVTKLCWLYLGRCGGRVIPVEYLTAVSGLVHQHGIKLHLDGSRVWNVRSGVYIYCMKAAHPHIPATSWFRRRLHWVWT
jgi:hypothetical protein